MPFGALHTNNQDTPLHIAVSYGLVDIVKTLIRRGASFHLMNNRGVRI